MTLSEKNHLAQKAITLTEKLDSIKQRMDHLEAAFQEFASAVFNEGFEIDVSGDALEAINNLSARIEKMEQRIAAPSKEQLRIGKLDTRIREVTERMGKAELNVEAMQRELNLLRATVREQAVELERVKLRQ